MKRSEIFALAKQAGGRFDGSDWRFCCDFDVDDLARFASLVAESEREACAKVCDELAKMAATPESAACWMRLDCATAIRKRCSA